MNSKKSLLDFEEWFSNHVDKSNINELKLLIDSFDAVQAT